MLNNQILKKNVVHNFICIRRNLIMLFVLSLFAVNLMAAQADMMIRRAMDVTYVGNDIYSSTGSGQTKSLYVEQENPAVYYFNLQNDGTTPEQFLIKGTAGGDGWRVRYFNAVAGGNDITPIVTGAGWTYGPLAANASFAFKAEIIADKTVAYGDIKNILISAEPLSDSTKSDTVKAITIVATAGAIPEGGAYTLSSDFEKGVVVGLEYNTIADQLQLTEESVTLPFLWVPNNDSTVSKIDTRTGQEIGRYRSCPANVSGGPSRTTVDQQGNCWVGNRTAGSVVKIGLYENGQYVDRNGNGVIDTSHDVDGDGNITGNEILPWGDDECVLIEVILISGKEGTYVPGTYSGGYVNNWGTPGPRSIAVDAENNIWVGTYGTKKFFYINGESGSIEKTIDVSSVGHTPYGAVIDAQGLLWSSGIHIQHVLWLDPTDDSFGVINLGHYAYGLGLDRNNHLFIAGWTHSKLSRVNVLTKTIDWTKNGYYQSRGVAVTDDGDVWVANTSLGTVTRWSNDGTIKANISVGSGPTGVAVDSAGKVWAVNVYDENICRIDPATTAVDLEKRIIGGYHYGYSDMCGMLARMTTTRLGTWTITHNSKVNKTSWGVVSWNSYIPAESSIKVRARSSQNQNFWSMWANVTNGVSIKTLPRGKYLQVEVTLQNESETDSPILYDLTIQPATSILQFDPEDDSIGVATNTNLQITYTTNITKGATGSVIIKSMTDDSVFETIPINDSRISISNNIVVINPTGILAEGSGYYILIDDTCFQDPGIINCEGIADKSLWNFITGDSTVPTNLEATDGTYTNKVGVSWDSLDNAAAYVVYRNTNDSLLGISDISGEITPVSYDDYSVLPKTVYYYWVRAKKDLGGFFTWSGYSELDTGYSTPPNMPPAKPLNLSPANYANKIPFTPELRCSDFVDEDTNDTHAASRWLISTTDTFNTVVWDSGSDGVNLNAISVPDGALTHAERYYWCVSHQDNNNNWSDYSLPTWFETYIAPTNQAPIAVANLGLSGLVATNLPAMNALITLDGSESYDDRTDTTNLYFDWREDVMNPVKGLLSDSDKHLMTTYITNFPLPGVYRFYLVVNDGSLNSGISPILVSVPGLIGMVKAEGYERVLPVYGVTLTTTNEATGQINTAVTDTEGNFVLDTGAATAGITINLSRFDQSVDHFVFVPEDGSTNNILPFSVNWCSIIAVVTNSIGDPVPYVNAQLIVGDRIGTTASGDLEGKINLGGIPELYPTNTFHIIQYQKDGYTSVAQPVLPNPGTVISVPVYSIPSDECLVSGTIVGTNGMPVANVEIDFGPLYSNVYSISNGTFSTLLMCGSYYVKLVADEFNTTFVMAEVPTGNTEYTFPQALEIRGGNKSVYGLIVDSNNSSNHIENAVITIVENSDNSGKFFARKVGLTSVNSTKAGYYDISGVMGERTLFIDALGYETKEITVLITNDTSYAASKYSINGNVELNIELDAIPEPIGIWFFGLVNLWIISKLGLRNK